MPKKMRQSALRSALSARAEDKAIFLVDEMSLPEAKTKLMAKSVQSIVGSENALVLLPGSEEYVAIQRASHNLPKVKTLNVNYLNIRDLLQYEAILMPVAALDNINSNLG
jgi:large subunit ribosomal protein L4